MIDPFQFETFIRNHWNQVHYDSKMWRPKSCCGLFSLEKGSVIIAIIAIIMAISASFGHGHVSFLFRFDNYYITYVLVFGDIILSVLFNFMLIYGISKERSAYFPPWIIFYVLNITVVSELSSKTTHLTTTWFVKLLINVQSIG